MKTLVCVLVCVLGAVMALPAFAGSGTFTVQGNTGRCQLRSGPRIIYTQGTQLWGTRQAWTEKTPADERSGVVVSVALGEEAGAPQLEGGRLVGKNLVGSTLQGEASGGQPVEVAICGAEPSAEDPGMVWYQIEAWNPVAQSWENPCVATGAVPNPRALVLAGTWDATGAHHADPRRVTFACEVGALAKCAAWGYKPWASVNGETLADAHQACTRMVRGDYCGDGSSHTQQGTLIDFYDSAGVAQRTRSASPVWNPELAAFEASWAPDGASCLSRTRDGRPLAEVLKECPGRFQARVVDLGDGDRCLMQRSQPSTPVLRNRSIPRPGESLASN